MASLRPVAQRELVEAIDLELARRARVGPISLPDIGGDL